MALAVWFRQTLRARNLDASCCGFPLLAQSARQKWGTPDLLLGQSETAKKGPVHAPSCLRTSRLALLLFLRPVTLLLRPLPELVREGSSTNEV
jgi:hypothetical protein